MAVNSVLAMFTLPVIVNLSVAGRASARVPAHEPHPESTPRVRSDGEDPVPSDAPMP